MKADVLIIEDELEISKLISDYLKKEGIDSICVESGEEGLKLIESKNFDLIILDINLPGIDGYEVLQKLRLKHNTSVIIVSARVDDADMILGYGMGADDFVSKPFSPRVLSAKIRTHINRFKNREDRNDYTFGDYILDIDSYCLKKDGERVKIRPKELDIIIYLAKNKGRIVSGEDLYKAVWNTETEVDLSTIAVHMRRIRDKIEKDPANPEYIKTVYGKGYFLAN